MSLPHIKYNNWTSYQVVSVQPRDNNPTVPNSWWYGSGVAVWRDVPNRAVYIAASTMRIQMGEGISNYVVDYAGNVHPVDIIIYDIRTRLAILRINNAPDSNIAVSLRTIRPAAGEGVYVLSWLNDDDASGILTGTVSSAHYNRDGVADHMLISTTDSHFNSGRSGGGVFHRSTGSFLGMLLSQLDDTLNFVIPAEHIRNAILSIQYEIRPIGEWSGLERCASDSFFAGFLGQRFHPARVYTMGLTHPALQGKTVGIRVQNVLPDSPATDAGLTDGMFVWAVSAADSPGTDDWILIQEESSLELIIDQLFVNTQQPRLLRTISPRNITVDPLDTITIKLLTSIGPSSQNQSDDDPNDYTIRTLTLPRSREFFASYEDQETLYSFLSQYMNTD